MTDWAREVVEKWYVQWLAKCDAYPDVKAFLANYIRAEHRRAVRVVEKVQREATASQFAYVKDCLVYKQACADILAALKKGR